MTDICMDHLLQKLLVVRGSVVYLMGTFKLGIVCWAIQRKCYLKRIRKGGYKFRMKSISDLSKQGINDAYFKRI